MVLITRALLIHAIIKGEDVRVEELIADNIAVIAQGMQGKGKLAFPSTIFKLCNDVEVPMREFKRTELIPQDKLITARLMETTRLGRNVQVQQQMMKKKISQCLSLREAMRKTITKGNNNTFSHNISNQKQVFNKVIRSSSSKVSTLSMSNLLACNFSSNNSSKICKPLKLTKRDHGDQEATQGVDKKCSSRDAYCCWAHQQANPNLTEIHIHQIPDLIQANAEKGRPIFYGGLKAHFVAGSSSQAAPSQAASPQPTDEPIAD
ncbi:hypothetical protein PIB30_075989 [Stylosanthes scabra]|uniref:Uncharacterized protein n=1 Tax=Stylosanthes scabra TaxID=79078 RepID=A0ABU6QR02_9FABA|nr:hypothetical protein [Stylosanthes scabra]